MTPETFKGMLVFQCAMCVQSACELVSMAEEDADLRTLRGTIQEDTVPFVVDSLEPAPTPTTKNAVTTAAREASKAVTVKGSCGNIAAVVALEAIMCGLL